MNLNRDPQPKGVTPMPRREPPATYTCRTQPNGWIQIAKFTDRAEPESVYHLEPLSDGTFACECPGLAHHGYCRHQRILSAFRAERLIDTGAVFDYATATFHRPPLYSDAEDARAIDVLALKGVLAKG